MLHKPQDAGNWGERFRVTPDDLQHLSTVLVDREVPLSVDELARVLVVHRWRQEQAAIEQAVSMGTLYRPKARYAAGESVVFPAFDYRVGVVTRVREGRNPEYGPFRVIQVDFGDGTQREFASELAADHILNDEADLPPVGSLPLGSVDELMAQYGQQVTQALEASLESDERFVRLAGKWFRRDLLVEINVGYLNLAEAVLDVAGGGPLPTEALLGDLDLPAEITLQLRVFSLNYALQEDERFDEVGPAGEVLWFLRRLEPEGVRTVPPYLEYTPILYDHTALTSEMLALERQLDDEWSDLQPPGEIQQPVVVVLTYPHWRAGTLPLCSRLATILPAGRTQRIHFTWVDADSGAEMPGWVVRSARYAFGLLEWYRRHEVPVGAYLEVSRGERPGTVRVRRRARRPRREWVRVALAGDGRLSFEMRQTLIACEYDELMLIDEQDARALDAVRARFAARKVSPAQLVAEVFPELAKLSPQGTVHAATLYSAANFAVRTPPGPLLAQLATAGIYAPMGDNYWVLRPPSLTP